MTTFFIFLIFILVLRLSLSLIFSLISDLDQLDLQFALFILH